MILSQSCINAVRRTLVPRTITTFTSGCVCVLMMNITHTQTHAQGFHRRCFTQVDEMERGLQRRRTDTNTTCSCRSQQPTDGERESPGGVSAGQSLFPLSKMRSEKKNVFFFRVFSNAVPKGTEYRQFRLALVTAVGESRVHPPTDFGY